MRYKDCFDKERRNFLGVIKRAGIAAGFIQASSMLAGVMLARTAEAQTSGANGSHDPGRMVECDGKVYIYSTMGGGKSSSDGLVCWTEPFSV